MRTFAERPKAAQAVTLARSARPATAPKTRELSLGAHFPAAAASPAGFDLSSIPVHAPSAGNRTVVRQETSFRFGDKSVNGASDNRVGLVEDKGTEDAGTPTPPVPVPVPKKKKAGVDSFTVKWRKNAIAGPTAAKLRLDYAVKLKKDADHDPAVAEFRQNAFHLFECTAGPNKGQKHNNDPLHDDNYSRADDTGGNAIGDVDFVSNDNPGASPLDKDDVIDYTFTAEQMIIDTAGSNKVVAKRGPHTATITGKGARAYGGVPKDLA